MYFCCVKTVAELVFGYINLSVVYFEYFITIFYILFVCVILYTKGFILRLCVRLKGVIDLL